MDNTDEKNEQAEEASSPSEEIETESETAAEETSEEEAEEEDGSKKTNSDDGMVERNQTLEAEKRQLQGLVDKLLSRTGRPESDEEEEDEEDLTEEEQRIVRRVERRNAKERKHIQNMVGGIFDRIDEIEITNSSLRSAYIEHKSDVEALRNEKARNGQYLKREEALALILVRKGRHPSGSSGTRVVKTKVKPIGETKKSAPARAASKEKTPEERLAGQKF